MLFPSNSFKGVNVITSTPPNLFDGNSDYIDSQGNICLTDWICLTDPTYSLDSLEGLFDGNSVCLTDYICLTDYYFDDVFV